MVLISDIWAVRHATLPSARNTPIIRSRVLHFLDSSIIINERYFGVNWSTIHCQFKVFNSDPKIEVEAHLSLKYYSFQGILHVCFFSALLVHSINYPNRDFLVNYLSMTCFKSFFQLLQYCLSNYVIHNNQGTCPSFN